MNEGHELAVEELTFLDEDRIGFGLNGSGQLRDAVDRDGRVGHAHVGDDFALVVPIIDRRLEHLDRSLGVKGAPGQADELLRLPRKHRAGDDGYLAGLPRANNWLLLHGSGDSSPSRSASNISSISSDTSSSIALPMLRTISRIAVGDSGSPISSS